MIYAFTVVFVIAFLITSYMVPRILLASLRKRLIDKPNKRKVHTVTSSRIFIAYLNHVPDEFICYTVANNLMPDLALNSNRCYA